MQSSSYCSHRYVKPGDKLDWRHLERWESRLQPIYLIIIIILFLLNKFLYVLSAFISAPDQSTRHDEEDLRKNTRQKTNTGTGETRWHK